MLCPKYQSLCILWVCLIYEFIHFYKQLFTQRCVALGGEETWSEEAGQFVQLMTTNQTLQAQVIDYTETGLPLVYLYCTQFYQSLTDQVSLIVFQSLEVLLILINLFTAAFNRSLLTCLLRLCVSSWILSRPTSVDFI